MTRYGEDVNALLREVAQELANARTRFAPINSPHEGKSVIEEELDELWLLVKANEGRSWAARAEAVQIAAMALRYVFDLEPGRTVGREAIGPWCTCGAGEFQPPENHRAPCVGANA